MPESTIILRLANNSYQGSPSSVTVQKIKVDHAEIEHDSVIMIVGEKGEEPYPE